MLKEIEKYKIGDPFDINNKQGPIARFDLFLNLKRQVIESLESGATLVNDLNYNEDIDDNNYSIEKGNFFKPIILENINENCVAYKEEMFGPVFCLFKFSSEDEAINLANDTNYGLGASIFTKNEEKGEKIAQKIDSGMVFVNSSTISDSRLPYGGTKESGYGRTSADEAFKEFTNNKLVSVRK